MLYKKIAASGNEIAHEASRSQQGLNNNDLHFHDMSGYEVDINQGIPDNRALNLAYKTHSRDSNSNSNFRLLLLQLFNSLTKNCRS